MRKYILVFITLLCLPLHSIAQESVGFSDPDDIQSLLDYRLPAWGYTNFYLDFSTNGSFRKRKSTAESSSQTDDLFSGRLSPHYIRHYESEPRIYTYRINPGINYYSRTRTSYNNDENNVNDLDLFLNWTIDEKLYMHDSDIFFTGSFSGTLNQTTGWDEEVTQNAVETDRKTLDRNFEPTLSIGIGYGRLRTVNPMIQSLRLNERLNALNTGQNLSQQDIIHASEQFTRLNGYQSRYDRPQKYFWGDMNDLLTTDLSALDTFDLLYLTDVTSETLGSRQEGWQVSANLDLNHSVSYSKDENIQDGSSTSDVSTSTFLIPNLIGMWSKNLSLRHQVGLNGSFLYQKELNDDSFTDEDGIKILSLSGNWLYTVTDRLLVNNIVSYVRVSNDPRSNSLMTLHSSIDYFVENSFSLFVNAEYIYNWNSSLFYSNGSLIESIDRRDIRFTAGLRYYINRGLF